jgi:hypothetical protein
LFCQYFKLSWKYSEPKRIKARHHEIISKNTIAWKINVGRYGKEPRYLNLTAKERISKARFSKSFKCFIQLKIFSFDNYTLRVCVCVCVCAHTCVRACVVWQFNSRNGHSTSRVLSGNLMSLSLFGHFLLAFTWATDKTNHSFPSSKAQCVYGILLVEKWVTRIWSSGQMSNFVWKLVKVLRTH